MMKNIKILFTLLSLTLVSICGYAMQQQDLEKVTLSGIIFDKVTFLPIPQAEIIDHNHKVIGISDDRGYFQVQVGSKNKSNFAFELEIRKENYLTLHQIENWGKDLKQKSPVMYFGLVNKAHKAKDYSELKLVNTTVNYKEVEDYFKDKVIKNIELENSIALAKKDNSDVLLVVDNQYFLVNFNFHQNTFFVLR